MVFGSSTSALDCVHFDSMPSTHSFAQIGFAQLVLRFIQLDSSTFLRSLLHVGLLSLTGGLTRPNVLLPVLGMIQPGPALSLHSSSRTGASISALQAAGSGFFILLRNVLYMDAFLLPLGMSRLEILTLVLDLSSLGLSMLLKSLGHPGSPLLTFGRVAADLPLFALDVLCIDSSFLARSLGCFDFPMLFSGLSRLDVPLLVLDMTYLGSLLSLRGSTCVDFALLTCGFTSAESEPPVLDPAVSEPTLLSRSAL